VGVSKSVEVTKNMWHLGSGMGVVDRINWENLDGHKGYKELCGEELESA